MTNESRVCFERFFGHAEEAAGKNFWPVGATLTVSFLDGDPLVKAKVRSYARKWLRYANVRFTFLRNPDPMAHIRISFLQEGSWSAVGADALNEVWFPPGEPTMNYGWLTPESTNEEYSSVVLHEFGHALGLVHEHQSPASGIQWNREAVIADLSGPPNKWDLATIQHNVFDRYTAATVSNYTEFDPKSIMLYAFPTHWTVDQMTFPMNSVLSSVDKSFIAQRYPR
ncbi:MAG: hypothetical protein DYG89_29005 [Caldilinea sp. CFX5]|nr:hypothetical protein [Caldilinea sp. CFX5]